jgi:cytoskeletal protein RodZ
MSKPDDKPMNATPGGEPDASAPARDAVPPTAELEAAAQADVDETESLLAGFDRAPRRPRREAQRDSNKDFVAHFSGKRGDEAPPPEPKQKDPARNAPTVIVPREDSRRPWLAWLAVAAAMLLVGWLAATAMIKAISPQETAADAPTVATTTVTMASPPAPSGRTDAVPPPDPADTASSEPADVPPSTPSTPPSAPRRTETASSARPASSAGATSTTAPSAATPATATADAPPKASAAPSAPRPAGSNGYIREL